MSGFSSKNVRELGSQVPDFLHVCNKKVSGDSWDTSADPHRVQDQPWSFHGPYRVLKMDLIIFKPISGCVYHFYILYII